MQSAETAGGEWKTGPASDMEGKLLFSSPVLSFVLFVANAHSPGHGSLARQTRPGERWREAGDDDEEEGGAPREAWGEEASRKGDHEGARGVRQDLVEEVHQAQEKGSSTKRQAALVKTVRVYNVSHVMITVPQLGIMIKKLVE